MCKSGGELVLTLVFLALLVYVAGFVFGYSKAQSNINKNICKQLYLKDTVSYIKCQDEFVNENIKLIKDKSYVK